MSDRFRFCSILPNAISDRVLGKLQERSPLQYFTKCVGVARRNNKVQSFVEEQAKAEGFNSPHEYIYQLILREQARVAQQNRVEGAAARGVGQRRSNCQ